jgi:hypothetical protein
MVFAFEAMDALGASDKGARQGAIEQHACGAPEIVISSAGRPTRHQVGGVITQTAVQVSSPGLTYQCGVVEG